jgi:hypothetical protein
MHSYSTHASYSMLAFFIACMLASVGVYNCMLSGMPGIVDVLVTFFISYLVFCLHSKKGVAKRCRLCGLTNSALVWERYISRKEKESRGCGL